MRVAKMAGVEDEFGIGGNIEVGSDFIGGGAV